MSFFDDDEKNLNDTNDELNSNNIQNDDEYEYIEVDEDEELEDDDEYEYVEVDEDGNEIVSEEKTETPSEEYNSAQNIDAALNPPQLANIQLEYAYLGLLFNNPKGISVYYFKYDECFFSNETLENLYKIVLFQDGEKYAPPQAKDQFNLPLEDARNI